MNTLPAPILIVDDEPQHCQLLEALPRPKGTLPALAARGACRV